MTSTFTLSCAGTGGTASASVTVTVTAAGTIFGLDFPGSVTASPTADCPGARATTRFQFLDPQLANPPLKIYPATYIWRAYPRQQPGYYVTFFWGTGGDEFWWDGTQPNSFYGAHPFPQNPPTGNTHYWEIATDRGADLFGDPPVPVVYKRWYTQALVAWDTGSGKRTIFYYDLPDTSKFIDHTTSESSYGNINPPMPALTWGDAPWIVPPNPNAGRGHEIYCGVLRGIQVYSTNLSVADILSEANSPLSTNAGAANIWYLNLDPTPSDISDKSGRGHNPAWVGSERPSLWSQ